MTEMEIHAIEEYTRLKAKLKINEGDIFVQDNLTVVLNVLGITNVIGGDPIYRVRLMATRLTPFNLIEVELYDYIANSSLTKLDTYRGDDEIAHDVIGVEFGLAGSLELRNLSEIKALVFGNSDQFAEMRGE